MLNLRNGFYFTWSRFHGHLLASIRKYKANSKGHLYPEKQGVCFNRAGYMELKSLIHSLVLVGDAAGIDKPDQRNIPKLNDSMLIEMVAQSLLDQINHVRGQNCSTCVKELKPDSDEIKGVMDSARSKKMVEATLLGENRVTPNGLVTFDCEKFLKDHDPTIRNHVAVLSGFIGELIKK